MKPGRIVITLATLVCFSGCDTRGDNWYAQSASRAQAAPEAARVESEIPERVTLKNRDEAFEESFAQYRVGVLGSALNALATHFPDDFEAFRRGARVDFERNRPQTTVVAARTILGRVAERERRNIVAAPDDYLISYLLAMRDAYQVAADDMPSLCNQISSGVLAFDRPVSTRLAESFSKTSGTLVEAAAAGKNRPTDREIGPPSEADITLIALALAERGIAEEQAVMIDNPAALAAADPYKSCKVRELLLDAVLDLPKPIAARFTASMFQHSLGTRVK